MWKAEWIVSMMLPPDFHQSCWVSEQQLCWLVVLSVAHSTSRDGRSIFGYREQVSFLELHLRTSCKNREIILLVLHQPLLKSLYLFFDSTELPKPSC